MSLSPLKKIYLKLLLKFFRVTGSKKFFTIQHGFLKGCVFNVHVDNDIFYGEYETDAVERIMELVKGAQPMNFYDIGAHYGFFSLVFSKMHPGSIYSFEPFEPNYNILQQTLELNNIRNVKAKNIAIANNGQSTVLFTQTKDAPSNTYIQSEQLPVNTAKKATPARSIDEMVREDNYPPPSFIKMDAEGAEYELLLGGLSTFRQYKPYILLATHDCHLPGVKDKCINLLNSIGYRTEKLSDSKAFDGLDDFLCIPSK